MSEENITSFYGEDHDRLDGRFKEFQQTKRSDFDKAREAFLDFKHGIQRHIIWEEEILFPVFEEKTGMRDSGPTEVMRREHRMIEEALAAIAEGVDRGDVETDAAEQRLLSVLEDHNRKEEQILYPAIDQITDPDQRRTMFDEMKAVPEDRYRK